MKLAPIIKQILKEAGEAAGKMELRKTSIENVISYIKSKGLDIPNIEQNLEIAYEKFNMGKTKRKDMPVIDEKDVKDFQAKLKNGLIDLTDPWSDRTDPSDPFPQGLDDKAATNFMSNGLRDKVKPDDRVSTQIKLIAVKDLIPIQEQVYVDKSIDSIAKFGVESSRQFLASTVLIASSDNRIIDGHHRFLSCLILDPDLKVKCLVVDLPIKILLPVATAYGDAKGNERNL